MLVAEAVDDLGAGGVAVAQKTRNAGDRLQPVGQFKGERRFGMRKVAPVEQHWHAGDFPVAALRVLAGRLLARGAPGAGKAFAQAEAAGPFAARLVRRRRKTEALQVRQLQRLARLRGPRRDVAEGIGAGVAVLAGVGQRAEAERVKQEDECAWHGMALSS